MPWSCSGFSSRHYQVGTEMPEEQSVAGEPGVQFEVRKDRDEGVGGGGGGTWHLPSISCSQFSCQPFTYVHPSVTAPTLGVRDVKLRELHGSCPVTGMADARSEPRFVGPQSSSSPRHFQSDFLYEKGPASSEISPQQHVFLFEVNLDISVTLSSYAWRCLSFFH